MSVGKVRTVLGDVDPAALGPTMMHEHLLITFGRWLIEQGEAFDWFEAFGWDRDDPRATAPISWETSAFVRRRGHPDNFLLDDVDLAIEETARYAAAGGGTIVDSTNADMTRDAAALRRISEATGVHVVMGSGNYWWRHHPPDMDGRSEQQLSDEIVREVTEGCDGTESRAGIIGEVACDYPMHPNERKALRAAVHASRRTGVALQVHPGPRPSRPAGHRRHRHRGRGRPGAHDHLPPGPNLLRPRGVDRPRGERLLPGVRPVRAGDLRPGAA